MSKIMTAYFSASGVTGKLAQRMASAAGSDIFEIRPENPYSPSDIKWTNPLARCNREKIGKKDVPIAGTIENFSDYDTFLIGFPIWYYGAPNIIHTFLKQYDFSGKKIALFATSGGSDITKTAAKLKPFLSDSAQIVASKLFQSTDSDEVLTQWVKTFTE